MRLRTLRLQNFRQHAETVIEFESGLTGIIGPNGAGKSTILEAIAWALYGNRVARGTSESIKWMQAPPRASVRVELVFDLGVHTYRVVRGITSAELWLDAQAAPIANSQGEVTRVIEQRLGMTAREFFTTYFTGQKELAAMAGLGPTDRGRFLSRVLGYDKLSQAQALVRGRRSELSAELKGLAQGQRDPEEIESDLAQARIEVAGAMESLAQATREVTAAEAAVTAALPAWERAQAARTEDAALQRAEVEAAEAVRSAERELARLTASVAEARAVADGAAQVLAELAPLPALRTELQALEEGSRAAVQRTALQEELARLETQQQAAEARLAQLASAPTLLVETRAALATEQQALAAATTTATAQREDWVRDRQEAETKRNELREQYVELKAQRDQLEALGPEAPCPTCQRPLGAQHVTLLDDLDGRMTDVTVNGQYYARLVEQLKEPPAALRTAEAARDAHAQEVSALERKLARIEQGVQELQEKRAEAAARTAQRTTLLERLAAVQGAYDAARHEAVRAQVTRLSTLEVRHAAQQAIVAELPAREAARVAAEGAVGAATARVAEAQRARAVHGFTAAAFDAAVGAWTAANGARTEAQARVVATEAALQQARVQLARAEALAAHAADLRTRQLALEGDRRLHDDLDEVYGALRTELNARLRPELGEIASALLRDLTDDRYTEFELDESYNIVLIGSGLPRQVISGGEEDLANLVLRLAISQLIAERSGQPFSLLVLDEVFGSLDEQRRANVVELLRRLQDRFEQVILITHIEGVRDGLDRVLVVTFDEDRGAAVVTPGEAGAGQSAILATLEA